MDVRTKQRLCFLACVVNFSGLGGGFAPRHLSRSLSRGKIHLSNMRNKLTNLVFILFILSFCFVGNVFAQIQETESLLNSPELKEFNRYASRSTTDASEKNLLFQVLWYEVPYPKYFYVLSASKNGQIYTFRYVPNWAIQNSSRIEPNSDRSAKIVDLLKNLHLQEQCVNVKPKNKEMHTAFIYLQDDKYKRVDFLGELPFDVQAIIDFAKTELAEKSAKLQRPLRKE